MGVLLGITLSFHLVLQGSTRFYWVFTVFFWVYWVLPGFDGGFTWF